MFFKVKNNVRRFLTIVRAALPWVIKKFPALAGWSAVIYVLIDLALWVTRQF